MLNPKIRTAAVFIDSTVPCSSMVIIPSTAVSTMAFSRTAASRTASSAFLRSVMSRDLGKSASRFSSSKMGVKTPLAKNRLPSLHWCHRSSLERPLAAAVAISRCGIPPS